MSPHASHDELGGIRFIKQTFDNADSQASALKLVLALMPEWASADSNVEFVRFTDGITNTLLKAVNRRPGLTKAEIDRDAILLRAYGNGTDVLIDREREAANHELLMRYNLAPDLLARFNNGMLYRFIPGTVANAQDLHDPAVLRAVARRLAEWHANVPCFFQTRQDTDSSSGTNGVAHSNGNADHEDKVRRIAKAASKKPFPNIWTTMQKWILALPSGTEMERARRDLLQKEMEEMVAKLSGRPGLGHDGLVFAHCDLLCANIIIHRNTDSHIAGGVSDNGLTQNGDASTPASTTVSFIDYEYGTPSPAAFDIANHFAEWAGYDCDYSAMPNYNQRHEFITEYIHTYAELSGQPMDETVETAKLMEEVDVFRGVPGLYWGIWSLIQATISHIDFDYSSYAELRLGEYWAFKAEEDGSRAAKGKETPLREKVWATRD